MPWYFVTTELLIYVFTVFIVAHAWRKGRGAVATFAAASLFGFVLEYMSVRSGTDYCYGKFMIMLPPWGDSGPSVMAACTGGEKIPLWIMLGWGITAYVAMTTTSKLNIPWKVRPLLDALLAVNIDWIMDPLAGHLGFWTWFHPGPWFGIPLDNYFGWIVTVGSFSFLVRWLWRVVPSTWFGQWRAAVIPFIAGAIGPAAVFGLIKIYMALAARGVPEWIMVVATLLAAQLPVLYFAVRVRGTAKPDRLLVGISVFFQIYYSAMLWGSGFYTTSPALAIISQATLCIAILGYCWPYQWAQASDSPPPVEGPLAG